MMAKKLRLFFYVVIVLLASTNFVFADEITKKSDEDKEKDIKIFAGYSWYHMKEFNEKLRREGNKEIKGGINVGLELSPFTMDKDEEISLIIIKVKPPIKLKIPIIGIEYLEAISETVHSAPGGSAVVKWDLPVVGVYVSVADVKLFTNEVIYFYFRPISVGIYNLGDILNAKLTVSDRPGSYDASDTTVGFATMFDLRYYFSNSTDNSKIFLSVGGGYRWLNFGSVKLDPKGGFTVTPGGEPAQKTTLPESLDYSGGIIKVNFGIEF